MSSPLRPSVSGESIDARVSDMKWIGEGEAGVKAAASCPSMAWHVHKRR
ncbi:hypothetical protein [Caballeronia sp. dw_19]|nr:hypothetical protein [Caballeronia sp. dw_19]